jgi:hypothetical protein
MFPISPALTSLSFNRSAALAAKSAIFLSWTFFFSSSSVASPLAFLIVPISFWRMLSSRLADSCSYWTARQLESKTRHNAARSYGMGITRSSTDPLGAGRRAQ